MNYQLSDLKRLVEAEYDRLFHGYDKVYHAGYPWHSNTGDYLILAGDLVYFKSRVIGHQDFILKKKQDIPCDDVPLLIRGGGGFGVFSRSVANDIIRWVSSNPHRQIVLGPRSCQAEQIPIHLPLLKALKACTNLTVLLRDQRSLELVQAQGLNCRLVPDSAWMLLDTFKPFVNRGDLKIRFPRFDNERSSSYPVPAWDGWETREWHGLRNATDWKEALTSKFAGIKAGATDKMHAHIAFCLMGIPNALYPNNYHKIESHYETWMKGNPLVVWRPDEDPF